jgi:prepilin-type N-terminal cleavage/methylation domain-containing protein
MCDGRPMRHPVSRAARARAGFTALELVVVLAIAATLAAMALPAVARVRTSAALQNARHAVVSTLALARATAIRYGRPVVVRVDPAADRLWIEADTTVSGGGAAADTVRTLYLSDEWRVDLESDRAAICFDGRGLGTTAAECPLPGATLVLAREGRADTVRVSAVGRVVP